MAEVVLRQSTGDPAADRIVRGVIGIFEQAFPDRVRGYYLRGSYARGTPTLGSDLDLFVVFPDRLDRAEVARARELSGHCALLSPILLEIITVSAHQLARPANLPLALNLKLATRLLYGQDIRATLPELSVDEYVRSVVDIPCHNYRYARDGSMLTYPLEHIDPTGEWLGFDRMEIPGAGGASTGSTKLLVATVCWTATGLIAMRAGVYVPDKAAAVAAYQEHVADEWNGLVVRVYELCRDRWHYRIPTGSRDRRELRDLCERALAFQNHFLRCYREFQLAELRSGAPERQALAAQRLDQVRFPTGRGG